MGKYIDADRLRAEIERRIHEISHPLKDGYEVQSIGKIEGLSELLDIIDSLQQNPRFPQYDNIVDKVFGAGNLEGWEYEEAEMLVALAKEELLNYIQQKQPEMNLDDFTKKMDDWGARYIHPYNIPIKATMAFTARMFYQYPNVARQWYDSLPKATMD